MLRQQVLTSKAQERILINNATSCQQLVTDAISVDCKLLEQSAVKGGSADVAMGKRWMWIVDAKDICHLPIVRSHAPRPISGSAHML